MEDHRHPGRPPAGGVAVGPEGHQRDVEPEEQERRVPPGRHPGDAPQLGRRGRHDQLRSPHHTASSSKVNTSHVYNVSMPSVKTTAPRRQPVQARSQARVERILAAATALVEDDGVDAATTRAIAARAGVPVATLYQFFADRDAVLDEVLRRALEA